MTIKELYEYAKNKECEDSEVIVRLDINDYIMDFQIKDTSDIYTNYYNDLIIEPKE